MRCASDGKDRLINNRVRIFIDDPWGYTYVICLTLFLNSWEPKLGLKRTSHESLPKHEVVLLITFFFSIFQTMNDVICRP